jgi:hypothetical protein
MITLSKVRSATVEAGKRILKVLQYGPKTATLASSFGDDSNPTNNLSAVYAETGETGEPVIIGFINENQLAAIGEKRLFSLDSEGNVAAYMWLKNDGNLELNGDTDNMVRFSELKAAFDQLRTDFNNHVTLYNTHVHPSVGAPTASTSTPSTVTIDAARIDNVKTN